jgi:hypothetical protein
VERHVIYQTHKNTELKEEEEEERHVVVYWHHHLCHLDVPNSKPVHMYMQSKICMDNRIIPERFNKFTYLGHIIWGRCRKGQQKLQNVQKQWQ